MLFITLNKSVKDYSHTTTYEDFSISEALFHWQSQSVTSADSPIGQRYVNHTERGSRVLQSTAAYIHTQALPNTLSTRTAAP